MKKNPINSIITGDAVKVLKGIKAGSVDMVFADPPFNVGIKYSGSSNKDNIDMYPDWCASWITECFRILKPTGTIYLMTITRHLENLYPAMKEYGVFINQVNWRNVASVNSNRSFWNEFQPILVYGKTDKYKFNTRPQTSKTTDRNKRWGGYTTEAKGQLLDYWPDIPFVYAGSVFHPEAIIEKGTNKKAHRAQMPVGLPERAMLFSTDKGDTVLDPFTGSGTTWEACEKHGRNFIGIEQSTEYVKIANKRIEDYRKSPQLFDLNEENIPPEKYTQNDFIQRNIEKDK